MLRICRRLAGRRIIFVGDAGFAVHTLAHALEDRATLSSRLRLNAGLFSPAPERSDRTQGRPALKDEPLPKLSTLLTDPATRWYVEVTFA